MSDFPPPPPGPPPGSQYGPPAPAPTGRPRLRGRIPLRLAAIFGVLGLAAAITGIVLIVTSPLSRTDDFARVDVNRQASVDLDRTGDYVVYFETPSGGRNTGSGRLQLTGPDGETVPLRRYANTLTYDLDGRHAEAELTFAIDRAGTYQVRSTSSNAPAGAQLAFGESVAKGIVAGVLTFVPGLLLIIAAVILLIVGLVRRSRHKRQLASAYQGGYGPNYFTGR